MTTVTPIEMVTTRTTENTFDADGHADGLHTADYRTVRALVADAQPMVRWQLDPTAPERRWIPQHLTIDYRRRDGEKWTVGHPALSGRMLRADGSVGQRRAMAVFSPWNPEKPPEWVTAFVAVAHPDAVIDLSQKSGRVGIVPASE